MNSMIRLFLIVLINSISLYAWSDIAAPVVTTEVGATHTIKETKSDLGWTIKDEVDRELDVSAISLKDSDGEAVVGISYQWDDKCPEGYAPNPDGLCEKIIFANKINKCDPPYTLFEPDGEDAYCEWIEVVPALDACPDTYALTADKTQCTRTDRKPADRACDAGWNLVGEHCEKTSTIPVIYSCDEGVDLIGDKCVKTSEEEIGECPSGLVKGGSPYWLSPKMCYEIIEPTVKICSSGYELYPDGSCVMKKEYPPITSCPSGFTDEGTYCSKWVSQDPERTCSNGGRLSGANCIWDVGERYYGEPQCKPGFAELNASMCVRIPKPECGKVNAPMAAHRSLGFVEWDPDVQSYWKAPNIAATTGFEGLVDADEPNSPLAARNNRVLDLLRTSSCSKFIKGTKVDTSGYVPSYVEAEFCGWGKAPASCISGTPGDTQYCQNFDKNYPGLEQSKKVCPSVNGKTISPWNNKCWVTKDIAEPAGCPDEFSLVQSPFDPQIFWCQGDYIIEKGDCDTRMYYEENGKCYKDFTSQATESCQNNNLATVSDFVNGQLEIFGCVVTDNGSPLGQYCPSDAWSVKDNKCVIDINEPAQTNCQSGYSVVGSNCSKTDSKVADYQCSDGWNLDKPECWRTLVTSSFKECADGTWTLVGTSCKATRNKVTDRVCQAPYTANEFDVCEQRFTIAMEQGDNFILDLPWLWPGQYTLDLKFADDANNLAHSNHIITYDPEAFDQFNGSDELTIPSVGHSFQWPDGKETFTSMPIEVDGDEIDSTLPIWVGLHKSAKYPVKVNGILIQPREFKMVHNAYDFKVNKGVLKLPLETAAEGTDGLSPVVFMVGSEGALARIVNVDSWVFSGSISKNADKPLQLFDPIAIEAMQGTDSCSVTAGFNTAKSKGAVGLNPYCFIDWDIVPSPLEATYTGTPKLQGKLDDVLPQSIQFSAYLVDHYGTSIKVGEVSDSIEGTDPYGIITTAFKKDFTSLYRTVQEVDSELKITAGPSCVLTIDEEKAKERAEKNSGARYCFVEWTELPGNLVQKVEEPNPELRGTIDFNGTHTVAWRVWTYNTKKMPVLLDEQSIEVVVTDPPPPQIKIHPDEVIDEALGLYAVSKTDSRLGDAEIISTNAYLTVKVYEDSTLIADDEYQPAPWQTEMNTYRRLDVKEKALWTETAVKVDAIYSKLTEVNTSKTLTALTVPDQAIMPFIDVDSTTALDTEDLPVTLSIRDTYNYSDGYDETSMGKWRLRVVKQVGWKDYEPVSGWVDIDSAGDANFNLDLEAIADGEDSLRLYGEAELVSEKSYYSRSEITAKPVFMTVLKGGELDGFIKTRYLSGEAPMVVRLELKMTNYRDYRALGDVVWEFSSDNGSTWQKANVSERYKTRFTTTFEEGKHLVRAFVHNKNSGVISETETIEIIAYRKPKIEVTGPSVVFVGDTPQYHADITFEGAPMAPEDVVIEWSEDAGQTWSLTGPDVSVTANEEKRIRLYARVRMPDAPADDLNAYRVKKLSVEFRKIKPPRAYIFGSRVVEVGAEFEFRISTRLPYPRMSYEVDGFWTLPDGTESFGETVTYTPTRDDLDKEYIEMYYTAWVKDWRDQGAEYKHTHKMRVWIYKWPEFTISERMTAKVAPANATLYVRPVNFVGQLDRPTYEWDIPGTAVILEDRNPYARIITLPVAGTYPISVTVRDVRGHETIVTKDIIVGEPDELTVTLDYSTSNDFMRAPFDILLRPIVVGGHPNDRIQSRTYSLNGQELEAAGTYARATLDEGTHVMTLQVATEMGELVTGDLSLTVAANQKPVCTIDKTDKTDGWIFKANCNDSDGRVVSYRWNIDGDDIPINTYRISVSSSQYEYPDVILEALDDSGSVSDPTSISISP